jgi:hypothetical protein
MDVKSLLQLAFPHQGETLDNLRDTTHQRTFKEFEAKMVERGEVRLKDLINYGSREDSPSLYLSEEAQRKMLVLVTSGCRSATVSACGRWLGRSLSLMPCYGWADRLTFNKDGVATYCAASSYPEEMVMIRKGMKGS